MAQYSYLGPTGTFTEAALRQVEQAKGQYFKPVNNVTQALADVISGESTAAMIAIENSIDGGVTATQDALAAHDDLRIIGEYLVPVDFVLVGRDNTDISRAKTVAAHPVAYAQCRTWLDAKVPNHAHLPAASNVQSVVDLLSDQAIDVAVAPPGIEKIYPVQVLESGLVTQQAVTRFVLVTKNGALPSRTGYDKTSVIAELADDRAGALLELLEQFAARGVNLVHISSRPVGDKMGRYRFVLDAEGHIADSRVAEALMGLRRVSPSVKFLGSYPRADKMPATQMPGHSDADYDSARKWLYNLIHC